MILAIIQARLASSRLPHKVLMDFGDTTILGYLINRLRRASTLDEIVVATTINREDDLIVDYVGELGVKVFRGMANDVLDRFYHAAKLFGADVIVRITADDPLKDPCVIDKAVETLTEGGFDYCSNTITLSYPEGLDVEVFTMPALEKAFLSARTAAEREHVTPYIWENRKNEFNIGQIVSECNRSHWRLTIDYEDDYQEISKLERLIKSNVNFNQLVRVIEENGFKKIMEPRRLRNEAFNEAKLNENW